MRLLPFLLILLFALPSEAANESKSLTLIKAQQGNAEAQRTLGLWYLHGRAGLRLDCAKAEDWLLKAAAQKDIGAIQYLSYLYDSSVCPQDREKADFWLREGAVAGNAESQWMLGDKQYKSGDFDGAIYWLERSAKQGNQYAQFSLAKMYEQAGNLVPQYYVKAYAWCMVSAAMGNTEAKARLLEMEFVIDPEQEAEAKQLAQEYQRYLGLNEKVGQ